MSEVRAHRYSCVNSNLGISNRFKVLELLSYIGITKFAQVPTQRVGLLSRARMVAFDHDHFFKVSQLVYPSHLIFFKSQVYTTRVASVF